MTKNVLDSGYDLRDKDLGKKMSYYGVLNASVVDICDGPHPSTIDWHHSTRKTATQK